MVHKIEVTYININKGIFHLQNKQDQICKQLVKYRNL